MPQVCNSWGRGGPKTSVGRSHRRNRALKLFRDGGFSPLRRVVRGDGAAGETGRTDSVRPSSGVGSHRAAHAADPPTNSGPCARAECYSAIARSGSLVRGRGISPVEMAEAEVEDLGFDVLV